MNNSQPISTLLLALIGLIFSQCSTPLELEKGERIALIGNNLGARLMLYGHFETSMHLAYPDQQLYIRNFCDAGDTPGFRAHSGRNTPWAFEGAEQFQTELAQPSGSEGHFEYPDQWLTRHKINRIIAFFGYNESFEGVEGLQAFKDELDAFIKHTLAQQYNGTTAPKLTIVSPIAFENLSDQFDLPDGIMENARLSLYTKVMKEVCATNHVQFVDAFEVSERWMAGNDALTQDGFQLNELGSEQFSQFLIEAIFNKEVPLSTNEELVREAVLEKNWFWHNDYKIPNGVHVFGRRYDPFGPDNYPYELEKIRQMTANRDTAIWKAVKGEPMDLTTADAKTRTLPEVETNYIEGDYGRGKSRYHYGDEALASFKMAPGYEVSLFASEQEFPDLANPVQMSFDDKGRLWVGVMPSYPHYKPGDSKPNDKLIILEDTDGDYIADKQTTFAEGLHLTIGFEFAPEGVYVSQGTHFKLLIDEDGDDRADREEVVLSGFDDHDTHHAISAFSADPSGAIYMAEGVFLHTNVETAYGPVRATNGGFYRYSPQRHHLERTAQLPIPNPWGIAFDEWGQNFFLDTSGPALRWMQQGSVNPRYGVATTNPKQLIEEAHLVRPTSGLEFISSGHFPDEVQGDIILNNTIGYLGIKQHAVADDGTGYQLKYRQDLISSSDKNFRPVDLEFAPDGSLYLLDWHNVLIGHMQHNARDPLRDHVHGRVYRITYPSRPLVTPAKVEEASITELLDQLKLPEYRSRYRVRRALRAQEPKLVLAALNKWADALDQSDSRYEHHLLEALWVSWGLNKVDVDLLDQLLQAADYRARAAAVRVLRYSHHQIPNALDWMKRAAIDEHGRVRLEAIIAASWMDKEEGLAVLEAASTQALDQWSSVPFLTAQAHLNDEKLDLGVKEKVENPFSGALAATWELGKQVYEKDGYCGTCHQYDGKGLPAAGFPPLAQSDWLQDKDRLIKLTLKGLLGPITVNDVDYPGQVPMTPFEGLLTDEEAAAVLTYVRNAFGNAEGEITSKEVASVRNEIADKKGYYAPAELE
ncbi:MAG: HEAT repeat domain-containing protein [Cytophagales bacterium]|nr:HEAT repeat domain-containing protein [Cytophagales bacterium]